MSRHSARHRRHVSPYIRLGASIMIPALVAAGTYVLLNDSADPRTTTTGDPDLYAPKTLFTEPVTTDTDSEPNPPTPTSKTPTSDPTTTTVEDPQDPTTTSSAPPEPDGESPSSPSESEEPADESTTPDEQTTDPPRSPTPSDSGSNGADNDQRQEQPPVELNRMESSMLDEINDDRADAGCPAVQPNAALVQSARAHSADMKQERSDSTTGSDGSSPQKRAYRSGYGGTVGEVAFDSVGYAPLAMVLNPLSRAEKAVVTDCKFNDIGIGAAGAGVKTYWTLDFGSS